MPSTPVTQALEAISVPHRLHVHASDVRSLAQAARERGLVPGQVVRSLLFRLESGEFILVLAAGPARVSWRRLRRHLGVSRITTATPSEVQEVTGYEPGAVSPYGLRRQIRILADRTLEEHDTLSIGAGIHNAGVVLARRDLERTLPLEYGDFIGE
ncbi:MAG: YbaK/EbsC family protein [Chloroflexi bacterium]|nr:YbaK/EbsC family protein [Chloroflexota bacterium]